jgi:hypothetical protein
MEQELVEFRDFDRDLKLLEYGTDLKDSLHKLINVFGEVIEFDHINDMSLVINNFCIGLKR